MHTIKQYTSVLILLFFTGKALQAQSFEIQMHDDQEKAPMIAATYFVNVLSKTSDYFYDDWREGEIHFIDGTVASDILLRYNANNDELIWLRKSDRKTGTVIKEYIVEFILYANDEKEEALYRKMEVPLILSGRKSPIFMQILTKGELNFYCSRQIWIDETRKKVYPQSIYFLVGGGDFKRVGLRRWSFLRSFDKVKRPALRKLINSHKLNLKNEKDMAKVVDLINQNKYMAGD
jgi:hypothetical protein